MSTRPHPVSLRVIGHPIAHSRSPAMHRAALAALAREGAYLAQDVHPSQLAAFVAHARQEGGLDGFNVTIPHKERVIDHLDGVTPRAQRIGAVNTVDILHGPGGVRCIGDNTDALGFRLALAELFAARHLGGREGLARGGDGRGGGAWSPSGPDPSSLPRGGSPPWTLAAPSIGLRASVLRAVVMGAGGAALAVVDALTRPARVFGDAIGTDDAIALGRDGPVGGTVVEQAGVSALHWVTHRPERAHAWLLGRGGEQGTRIEVTDWAAHEALIGALAAADLVVNATSVGMPGGPAEFPASFRPEALGDQTLRIDLVVPLAIGATPLLSRVRPGAQPARCDGRAMLAWQGALALAGWLGAPLPCAAIVAMRQALAL